MGRVRCASAYESTFVVEEPNDFDTLGQAVVGSGLSFSLSLVFPNSKMVLEPITCLNPSLSWFRTLFFTGILGSKGREGRG